ncbi:MAG: serine hydrolase domain-containing protein [Woeseia sp.]
MLCPNGLRRRHILLAAVLLLPKQIAAAEYVLERKDVFEPYPAHVEQVYFDRLQAYRRGSSEGEIRGGLRQYDTLERVPGADQSELLPTTAAGDLVIPKAALEAARRYAESMRSSAFIVWHQGKVVEESYFGGQGREQPIISRSLAKPITTLAVGTAMHAGHIESLDQPVADFIDEWVGTEKEGILIRHLLDMRSGLLPQDFSDDPMSIYNLAYLHPYHERILVDHYPLVQTPGSHYEYSNAASDLVAVLIERATGVSYHEWVSQAVLIPIGSPGGEVWVNRPGGVAHAGCCMLLPAEAWLRMGILLLQRGIWNGERLLDEAFIREISTGTGENVHAGLGVFVAGQYVERRGSFHPRLKRGQSWHSEPYLSKDLFLFDGYASQVVYVIPDYELVILRTGISPPRTDPEWDNTHLPNLLMRSIDMRPRPPPQPH